MDVSIFVEATFDDGVTKRRSIGQLRRALDEFGSENLGLFLDDAKTLLRSLQEAIVQDQVGEAMEAELRVRHSFWEAARLIEMFLPCSAQLNTTV